jgi:hypothetical protein
MIFAAHPWTRAFAQAAGAEPVVTATAADVTRVESWSYFDPPPEAGSDPSYTFSANRMELGAWVDGLRVGLGAAFSYVRLENLPTHAIGPGGLGAGAFYFSSAGLRYSYQLYLSELTLRARARGGRVALTVGRMPFSSSSGSAPARPARDLDRLVRDRVASRLIGNFEYALYQRRFDGLRLDITPPRGRLTAAVFLPTQGGYEESANLTMPKLQVATVSWSATDDADDADDTHEAGGGQVEKGGLKARRRSEVFATFYRDRRAVTLRPDNTDVVSAPRAAVSIAAFGGSLAALRPTRPGKLDVVLWGAAETGTWYGLSHRAAALAVEGGHQWQTAPAGPWIRGGLLYASGDGNPRDDTHRTFFAMLPSARQYALSSAYTQMNLRDVFAQAIVTPGRWTARAELHRLDLANGQDLWYQGSGATAKEGRYFGFSGLRAYGATALGTVIEGSVDVPIRRHWSMNGYTGTIWGGDVVRASFVGRRLRFWYVENVVRF